MTIPSVIVMSLTLPLLISLLFGLSGDTFAERLYQYIALSGILFIAFTVIHFIIKYW